MPPTTIKLSKTLTHFLNKMQKLKIKKYLLEQGKYSRNLKLQLNTLTLIMLTIYLEISTNRLNLLQRQRNKALKILTEELNRVH